MPSTAKGTAETSPMNALSGTTLYDQVEATTFLTAPGTVTVGVGNKRYTFQADAGVQSFYAPLGAGVVSVKVTRNGVLTAGTTSSHPVVLNPAIQDMDYVGASSGRTPTDGPTTTGTETFEPQTFVVPATADTYVQGLAATANSGAGSSLVSNGTYAANAYLRFALPATPAGTTLTKAALQVWVATNDTAGSAAPHSVTMASNSWDEMTVNWNTKPAWSAAASAPSPGPPPSTRPT